MRGPLIFMAGFLIAATLVSGASAYMGVALRAALSGDPAPLTRLAEGGDAAAQLALAELMLAGRGIVKDAAAAVAWMRKAGEQGSLPAQMMLAMIYREGSAV
ncbi:MAG: hypothetical protein VW547_10780, partial [Alphaproteobacteria bacterium]